MNVYHDFEYKKLNDFSGKLIFAFNGFQIEVGFYSHAYFSVGAECGFSSFQKEIGLFLEVISIRLFMAGFLTDKQYLEQEQK